MAIGLEMEGDILAEAVSSGNNSCNADGVPLEPGNAWHVEEDKLGSLDLGCLQTKDTDSNNV